jgi:ATP-binding cassette subfamily F protein 3
VQQAEAEITRLMRELQKVDATLADGSLFATDPARAAELSKTRAKLAASIAASEEEWLAASSAIETA